MSGIDLIREELENQKRFNNDEETELLAAAMCYIDLAHPKKESLMAEDIWPWTEDDWEPADTSVKNLIKAGALIAAEIDRQNKDNEIHQ